MVYNLLIRVVEIKRHCSIYKIGDTFRLINSFKLVAEKPLCMHSLASIMPYYIALSKGVDPKTLGLVKKEIKPIYNIWTLASSVAPAQYNFEMELKK